MAYNINLMPRTMDEWDQLIEHYTSQSLQKHDAAVAAAKARAEAAWAALPADANRPALADYVAQAIACIEPAWSRADWEAQNPVRSDGVWHNPLRLNPKNALQRMVKSSPQSGKSRPCAIWWLMNATA